MKVMKVMKAMKKSMIAKGKKAKLAVWQGEGEDQGRVEERRSCEEQREQNCGRLQESAGQKKQVVKGYCKSSSHQGLHWLQAHQKGYVILREGKRGHGRDVDYILHNALNQF